MSDELVKRLRELADCDARSGEPLGKAMREAADRIEAQSAAMSAALERLDASLFTNSEHQQAKDILRGALK